jgi:NAD(P)-dependent dehydrogenase (short-subunit alcohol dehydrogenase family)
VQLKLVGDQVAVLMGASSGIGRETALRFARKGAKVVVSARGEEGLDSLVEEIRREDGEVIDFHRLPTPLVWIEHFEDGARGTPEDPHTFDMVTFASYEVEELGAYMGEERKRIGEPSWKPLDRATVEALIGEEA